MHFMRPDIFMGFEMVFFNEIEEELPIDQYVKDALKSLRGGSGSQDDRAISTGIRGKQDPIAERLDKIIILLGRLAFEPKNAQLLPKVFNINIQIANTDVPLGMKIANSITFYEPEVDLQIKMEIILNGAEVIMTEYKKIPAGRDTKIDGIPISEIYYSNATVTGGTPVEVMAVWI